MSKKNKKIDYKIPTDVVRMRERFVSFDDYAQIIESEHNRIKQIYCSHCNSDGKCKIKFPTHKNGITTCKKCGARINTKRIPRTELDSAVETVLRALEAIKILGSESPEHVRLIGSIIINITNIFNNPEYLDKITPKDDEENDDDDETDRLNADGTLCVVDDNT